MSLIAIDVINLKGQAIMYKNLHEELDLNIDIILDSINEPICIINNRLDIIACNAQFTKDFATKNEVLPNIKQFSHLLDDLNKAVNENRKYETLIESDGKVQYCILEPVKERENLFIIRIYSEIESYVKNYISSNNTQAIKKISETVFEGLVITQNRIITEVNESFLTMFDYDIDEVLGKKIDVFLLDPYNCFVPSDYLDKKTYVIKAQKKNGYMFPVKIREQYISHENDTMIFAIRDISESELLKKLVNFKENIKIILVEDNKIDAKFTEKIMELSKIPHSIKVFTDGQEAKDFFQSLKNVSPLSKPDLILLDLYLPNVHGIEILRSIRANEVIKDTPVIILSSSEDEKDVSDAINLGVRAFIRKPFTQYQFFQAMSMLDDLWFVMKS